MTARLEMVFGADVELRDVDMVLRLSDILNSYDNCDIQPECCRERTRHTAKSEDKLRLWHSQVGKPAKQVFDQERE